MTLAAVEHSSSPTVAVAFGGGGARGLAHIHVIEALDELGIRPVAITGSSIGAIMGAGMAAGMSGAEIRDFTLSTVGRPRESRISRAERRAIRVMGPIRWRLKPSFSDGELNPSPAGRSTQRRGLIPPPESGRTSARGAGPRDRLDPASRRPRLRPPARSG